jgi:hypothetical protein
MDDSEGALYNDLLILKSIVPNVPQRLYAELLREINSLDLKIKEKQHAGSASKLFKDSPQPTAPSLENIMRVLAKVEDKDLLLEDFLICSGYTTSQSVATN